MHCSAAADRETAVPPNMFGPSRTGKAQAPGSRNVPETSRDSTT